MATGAFGSTAPPEKLAGFLVQAQARIRLGLAELWGALETTSAVYTAYSTSIGIVNEQALDVGKVASVGANIGATVEPFDAANERLPSIYYVTGEVCEITFGATQFNPTFIQMLLHHAQSYSLASAPNNEFLLSFGTLCNITSQPLQLDVTNLACFLPAGQDIELGLTALILTIWDVISTSGFNWAALAAKTINTMDVTFTGRPVESLGNGLQVGSLYAF
jgi:hypothetical protein